MLARVIVYAALTALALGVLAGVTNCATELPICPKPAVLPIKTASGTVFVLDIENVDILKQRMAGLYARRCEPGDTWAVDMRKSLD
jgi:hypothetical protein